MLSASELVALMGHRAFRLDYYCPIKTSDEECSRSLTHDLVLPIWKSNSSISLMIDKKAKR